MATPAIVVALDPPEQCLLGVFVPGGMPSLTYVARDDAKLESSVRAAKNELYKLLTVTGATKSGKTVLVSNAFPPEESIWIHGGSVLDEDDL